MAGNTNKRKKMIKDIRYSEQTYYVGRNGTGKQIGLGFTPNATCVLMEPINSKNHIANCAINVPYNDIPEVIKTLKKAYDENSIP